jgi:hypothetical protein
MQKSDHLEVTRLRAAAAANGQDVTLWRWYSDLMQDHRLHARTREGRWTVSIDGRLVGNEQSFDSAVRSAFATSIALASLS